MDNACDERHQRDVEYTGHIDAEKDDMETLFQSPVFDLREDPKEEDQHQYDHVGEYAHTHTITEHRNHDL